MFELLSIIFFGFILDLILGDPPYRYHPVRIMGLGIARIEASLKKHGMGGKGGGIFLVLITECLAVTVYIGLSRILRSIHPVPAYCFDLFICYSCLALKDLFHHIVPVTAALNSGNLTEARMAVAKVVGRDVNYLDKEGITRAAVETISESFVDGFLTPIFWLFAGSVSGYLVGLNPVMSGLSLVIFAKAASTLDSMVGYKNASYSRFGWAGARLDDLINFLPARLSLITLFLGAWISGLEAINGLRVALRDRLKHDSPNSAHAESFVAGALNIRLGGPTRYHDGLKNKPWLGEGRADPGIDQIGMTKRLIMSSAWVSVIIICSAIILLRNF